MKKKKNNGIILVTALWIMMLISVLSVLVSYKARLQLKSTSSSRFREEADYLARGAALKAIADITSRKNQDVLLAADMLFPENWLITEDSEDSFLRDYTIKVTVLDEESLINFSYTTIEILERMFFESDFSDNAPACLMDWIDADDDDSNNGLGTESDYYLSLKDPYACPNLPLRSQEEILFIANIGENGRKLFPFFTVLSDGLININTVNQTTMEHLGFSYSLIEKIVDYRNGLDGDPGTEDDRFFEDSADIVANLEEFWYVGPEEKEELKKIQKMLKTNSSFFRISVTIEKNVSHESYSAEASVQTNKTNWVILSWKE